MIPNALTEAILLGSIIACLAVPLYCYLFYPLILSALPRGRYSVQNPDEKHAKLPFVSVIISAYNEEKHIANRVSNLLGSDYPEVEILIGSDGSTDRTNEILERIEDSRLRPFLFSERRGKVSVLNDLAAEAKGSILVFSDANTSFQEDNIRRLVARFTTPDVACVCGKLIFVDPATGEPSTNEGAYWKLETFLKTVEGSHGSLLGANGANFAIRKASYINCPADTLVEDFLMPMLMLQKGRKVVYAPEAVAIEETAPSVRDEFRRRVRIGAGAFQSIRHLYKLLNPLSGFPFFAFLSHKMLRWLTPFFITGAVFMTLAMTILTQGIFVWLLVIEVTFGLAVLGGWIAQSSGRQAGWLGLPYYFFSMNAALLVGFFRWLRASQGVTWTRTPRSDALDQQITDATTSRTGSQSYSIKGLPKSRK